MHLHREQLVPLRREEAFRFFEDPYNLLKITPPALNLSVTNPDRIQMRKGAEITYTIRWMGVPLKWRTVITRYDPPAAFTDVQVSGPYRKWEHTHTFIERGDSTLIADDVEYELPLGALGYLFAGWLVTRQLEEIFDHRNRRIVELLGG
jgi:ligand-binding SRPBCC domain-containing protein